jgi:hypothetical protein
MKGIVSLRKHVNSYHPNIIILIEKEINCPLKEDEIQLSKKRPNVSSNSTSFLLQNNLLRKMMCGKNNF